jgi:hypothetical protein
MKHIRNSTLLLLFFMLGPIVAMIGHFQACDFLEIESTIRMCGDGTHVPRYWTTLAASASSLPAVLLVMRFFTAKFRQRIETKDLI